MIKCDSAATALVFRYQQPDLVPEFVSESQYDGVGSLLVLIDANGQVTTYQYDERDGLSEVWESPTAWTNPANTYLYDQTRRQHRITGPGTPRTSTKHFELSVKSESVAQGSAAEFSGV